MIHSHRHNCRSDEFPDTHSSDFLTTKSKTQCCDDKHSTDTAPVHDVLHTIQLLCNSNTCIWLEFSLAFNQQVHQVQQWTWIYDPIAKYCWRVWQCAFNFEMCLCEWMFGMCVGERSSSPAWRASGSWHTSTLRSRSWWPPCPWASPDPASSASSSQTQTHGCLAPHHL